MFKLVLLAHILGLAFAAQDLDFEAIYEWKYINYTWPSPEVYAEAIESGRYIPGSPWLVGPKFWKDKIFLTTPRFVFGVPAVLSVISLTPVNGEKAPLLEPFPSWDWQIEGDCNALQLAHSVEIDPLGRMWIIDAGRTEILADVVTARCPPRLIILDLEDNNNVLRIHEFPNDVALHNGTILNDIVIDHEDGGWAYITDSSQADPGIVVYSLEDNKSWKIRNNASMTYEEGAENVVIGGVAITATSSVNGITLTPIGSDRVVFYSPFPSFHVYSIPTSALKDSSLQNPSEYISVLGERSSQSAGMIMTNQGDLYFGLFNADAVVVWHTNDGSSLTDGTEQVFQDHVRSQWLDTFAIDGEGGLWYAATKQQLLITDAVDITEVNMRLFKAQIGQKSYLYQEDGTAPEWPEVEEICED